VKLAAALAVLLSTLAAGAAPSVSPQAALQQSKLAIQRHEYKEAEDTLKPLLDQFPTEEGLVEAHKLLASSYYFQNKKAEAEQEVIALLALRPDYKLDPVIDQPVLVRFFDKVRGDQAERLAEIKKRQDLENERLRREDERRRIEEHAKAQRVFVEKEVHRNSRLVAMLPFGIGQAQNRKRGLAALFASSELAFGAVSLSLWIALQEKFPGGRVLPADEHLATTLSALSIGFGAAFWGMFIAGIIEAQANFVPEIVRTKELPSKPRKQSWNLLPMLSPGQFGVGLQGVF
jgi:tetratricopeptide (TPR) repeat protein